MYIFFNYQSHLFKGVTLGVPLKSKNYDLYHYDR